MDREQVADKVAEILDLIFPSWREHPDMDATPMRVAKMWGELLRPDTFNFTLFANDTDEDSWSRYDQIILQCNIPFKSMCAHHMLPFVGVAHVAYIPDAKYCGLSKLSRAVDYFGRTLSMQEAITQEIGRFLEHKLHPQGCAVIIEAEHMCMSLRGVERQGVRTTTSYMGGVFRTVPEARAELMALVAQQKGRV